MKREARIFKALSEEVRLRLMVLLVHGELRVQDLIDITGLPQSTISRHLAYLRNEGLVSMRAENVQSVYGVNRNNRTLVKTILGCLGTCFADNEVARKDLEAFRGLAAARPTAPKRTDCLNILFVCVHNAARSQMAAAFAGELGGEGVCAASAGFEPGQLNPLIIRAMKEVGISMSGARSRSIDDLLVAGRCFDYVVTVCAESEGQRCPVFPSSTKRIHWEFEDPSTLTGTDEQKLGEIRHIRDRIKQKVSDFLGTTGVFEKEGCI